MYNKYINIDKININKLLLEFNAKFKNKFKINKTSAPLYKRGRSYKK